MPLPYVPTTPRNPKAPFFFDETIGMRLLQDKELARKFGENGRDWAFNNFNPKKIVQEWAELLARRLA